MKAVLLVRHGATAGNLQKRYIGRTDEPLCPEGIALLKTRGIPAFSPDGLFVSPMRRARQTAALLFPGRTQTVIGALRETDFGVFEGKTAAELSGDPRYRAWVETGCTGPIPGGDDPEDFKRRCRAAFAAAMETVPEGGGAAFVIHGGGIMAIVEYYARPRRGFYDTHVDNGAALPFRYDGKKLL